MQPAFNQLVRTPYGQGRCSGTMKNEEQVLYLVRLPINDQTKDHLLDSNCLTPKANFTGLWKFHGSELQ